MKLPNADSIEERIVNLDRALSIVLFDAKQLASVVEEQSARIEALESASVKHESEPDTVPYRMAEPTNIGAVVTYENCRYVRTNYNWANITTGGLRSWDYITNPLPYQNCVLTADDPEPPIGSVVLDCEGDAWQRSSLGHEWCVVNEDSELPWRDLNFQLGPLTLIHRGHDPDSGEPRATVEEFLQSVRADVEEFLRLDPAEREKYLLAQMPRCYLCSVRPVSYDGGLCGDCTDSLTKLKDTFSAQIKSHQ